MKNSSCLKILCPDPFRDMRQRLNRLFTFFVLLTWHLHSSEASPCWETDNSGSNPSCHWPAMIWRTAQVAARLVKQVSAQVSLQLATCLTSLAWRLWPAVIRQCVASKSTRSQMFQHSAAELLIWCTGVSTACMQLLAALALPVDEVSMNTQTHGFTPFFTANFHAC